MLTIPDSVKALFKTDGVRKNFRVHFPNGEYSDITNENIVSESVKFTESLCSQSVFKFGLSEASVLEFECVGIGNMYGMTIEAGIEIDTTSLSAAQITAIQAGTWDGTLVLAADSDIGYGYFRVPLGVFRVEKCPRNHGAMTHRQVTAYQIDLLNDTVAFPTKSLAKDFKLSLNGIAALKTGIGLTEATPATISTSGIDTPQYDSGPITGGCIGAGAYQFSGNTNFFYKHVWLCTGTIAAPVNAINYASCTEDVILPTGTINQPQIDQLRSVIAEQLTAAGVDLTKRSASGNTLAPVYSDNLEALKGQCIAFGALLNDMSPNSSSIRPRTVWDYYVNDGWNASATKIVCHSYPVIMDTLNPVIGTTNTSRAFYCEELRAAAWSQNHLRDLVFPKILTSDNVFLAVYDTGASPRWSYIKLRYAEDNIDLLPFLSGDINITSVRQFSVDTPSPWVTMKNTGDYTNSYYAYLGGKQDFISLLKSTFEIFARFYKADRIGGGEAVQLDNSSPASILPGNYSEAWWDEYDVEPIGNVLVSYKNAEENGASASISLMIGSGASVYDMSDNETLAKLDGLTETDLQTLIDGNFAPHIATVVFTPAELTMQGWPWIEAGDALEITAEDGTTVDTYALRIEMSGIQLLQMSVTAQGGEIVEGA